MSNALAIAAVTAVLRDLLQNALIEENLTASVGDIIVSVRPPGQIIATDNTPVATQLNLFMYQLLTNTGWQNAAMPSRSAGGERLSNQPLALDLRYLLTAYGENDFEAEILLGYGMQVLHETSILPRDAIRAALSPPAPFNGGILPPAFRALSAADLADQVEAIKITPLFLNMEEMSELWSTFQVFYRPSMAYHVSVVLIESQKSTRAALPVRRYGLYTFPFKRPRITRVEAATGPSEPVLAGEEIIIRGQRLRGEITRVLIDSFEIEPESEDASDTEITIAQPAGLRAGVHAVQVLHYREISDPPRPHRSVSSNVAAFLLLPEIQRRPDDSFDIGVSDVEDDEEGRRSAMITVSILPAAGRNQRIVLLLNRFNAPEGSQAQAYSFFAAPWPETPEGETPPTEFNEVSFEASGMQPGEYLVRIQVDGAESGLVVDEDGKYDQPRVTI